MRIITNTKQNICFWLKKVVPRFDKKSHMAEKEHWWREESVFADPDEEDPISEYSNKTLSLRILKRILSMRNLKGTFITVKPKDNVLNEDPQELQDPQWFLRRKLTLFGLVILGNGIWLSGWWGQIFKEKFWSWKASLLCYQSLKNWS